MKEIQREIRQLERVVRPLDDLRRQADDLMELQALGEHDSDFLSSLNSEIISLGAKVAEWAAEVTRQPHDHLPAFVSITPGGGGDEACLWAQMILRMYCMYAKRKGLEVEVVDVSQNKIGGIKYATLRVSGPGAYGLFRQEDAVHRLSRVSPLGHSERHTSFCSVTVEPEVEEAQWPEINEKDIEMHFCCGSGPGGQNKNKRATTVRIKHLPTGLSVRCETERSQYQNRCLAMSILAAKLAKMEEQRRLEAADEGRRSRSETGFGYRDRSYVLTQGALVHDHRTGKKTPNVHQVLDGDLDLIKD